VKIKYVGSPAPKKVQTPRGRIYEFKKSGDIVDISEKSLCEHLINNCNGRFEKIEVQKPIKKKG